ncbi:glycosyltransferase family 4 protein [Coxiella burnetii]|uniref:glycosyltransferase family 4 protein n=1 Tax=Coxiella burnetii TaxID=777 RepID=UPI00051F1B39|nr:glycosyltransferase family 4 protein [Coxiella burnetii]AIT62984.1 Glycosyl transferase, group 1 family protein [Coxiella burnetii str. Namibia]
MKKKLLIVINNAKFFISHRLSLAKAAKVANYDVHVATPVSPLIEKIKEEGFSYHAIQIDRCGFNPFKDIFALFSLWKLYRRLQPDIVHHVAIKPVLYGGIAARLAGVPAVVNALTGLGFIFIAQSRYIRILRSILQQGYKLVFQHKNTCVIFQNEDDRTQFLQTKLLDPNNSVLIPGSGVSMSAFYPMEEMPGVPRVILASRLLWDKGVGEFVEAAKILKQKKIDACFILVGGIDSENPSAINQKQLEHWESEGLIEWWRESTEMLAIMHRANIVCLPSYREGLPRVLVEAAASGRAIVTTDVPGCRDVVCDGENGLLVPVKNSEELASAIEILIQNPELRKEMGRRGRARVESKYELDKINFQTMMVYETLLKKIS